MIQEPMRSYPAFFDGKDLYSLNSLVYPVDTAVVSRIGLGNRTSLKNIVKYYQSLGLGPKNVLIKDNKNVSLFEKYLGIFKDKELFHPYMGKLILSSQGKYSEEILKNISKKFDIDFKVLKKDFFGLGEHKYAAIEPEFDNDGKIVSGLTNDDIWLRETISNLDLKRISLDFVIINKVNDIISKKNDIDNLFKKRGSVVVKTTGMAAGLGIKKVFSFEEMKEFISEIGEKYGFSSRFIITEDIYSIIIEERSMQIFVEADGIVNILGFTKNLVRDNANFGNMMSTNRSTPVNKIAKEDFEELQELADYIAKIGYRGYASFDLGLTKEGMKIFEINGRMGGASPLVGVLPSLKKQYKKDICLVIETIQISKKTGVSQRLRDLRLTKKDIDTGIGGLIPMTEAVLPQKISLIAVDFSEDACLKHLEGARKIL